MLLTELSDSLSKSSANVFSCHIPSMAVFFRLHFAYRIHSMGEQLMRRALYTSLFGIVFALECFGQGKEGPSLKETLDWIQNTAHEHPAQEIRVDACTLLAKEDEPRLTNRYTEEGCLHPIGAQCNSRDMTDLRQLIHGCVGDEIMDDTSIDVLDGKDHAWQWIRDESDFSYSDCTLTVKKFHWWSDKVVMKSKSGYLDFVAPQYHVSPMNAETISLKELNPDSASASQPSTYKAKFYDGFSIVTGSPDCPNCRLPKYKTLDLPAASKDACVQAKYTDEEQHMTHLWCMDYTYAERFAKALKHAISLCGGKPPVF